MFTNKRCYQTNWNLAKEEKGRFPSMSLGILATNLLGNMLSGKGIVRGGDGFIQADEGTKVQIELLRIFKAASFFK